MKKQSWNFHYGNKGFVFLLDTAIAILLTFILLTTAYYYVIKSEESTLSNLQIARTGSDILAVLDYGDMLKPIAYQLQIKNKMNNLLPKNYDMKIEIDYDCVCSSAMSHPTCSSFETTQSCQGSFSIGNEPPNDRFVASGNRFFVRKSSVEFEEVTYDDVFNYGKARYWIWLK